MAINRGPIRKFLPNYANVYVTIQSHGFSAGARTHYVTANGVRNGLMSWSPYNIGGLLYNVATVARSHPYYEGTILGSKLWIMVCDLPLTRGHPSNKARYFLVPKGGLIGGGPLHSLYCYISFKRPPNYYHPLLWIYSFKIIDVD